MKNHFAEKSDNMSDSNERIETYSEPVLAGASAPEDMQKDTVKPKGKDSFITFMKELPALIITAVVIAFVVKWLIVQPFYIPSQSMEPTLVPGDQVLVSKFIYRFVSPEPGNIIVFIPPNNENVDFIKRIVAVGGDTVQVKEGLVFVNGKQLQMDYRTEPGDYSNFGPKRIPEDFVFVMGDNRSNSMDSRVFGPVPKKNILGRAFMIHWPLSHTRLLNQ
jgi:signal peptidase I